MKSPGTAAVLAAIVGALLFLGVGHIYVGRIGRGLALLVIGLAIDIPIIISICFFGRGWPITITILLGIASFALWAWSIYDAYSLAKKYNEHLQLYGRPPW
jgi:TM2 domain-containing membrane protein YozV